MLLRDTPDITLFRNTKSLLLKIFPATLNFRSKISQTSEVSLGLNMTKRHSTPSKDDILQKMQRFVKMTTHLAKPDSDGERQHYKKATSESRAITEPSHPSHDKVKDQPTYEDKVSRYQHERALTGREIEADRASTHSPESQGSSADSRDEYPKRILDDKFHSKTTRFPEFEKRAEEDETDVRRDRGSHSHGHHSRRVRDCLDFYP